MKHFRYTDNLTITTQGQTFEEVEENLNVALNKMKEYYNDIYLAKTQITAFYLRNKNDKRKLRVNWKGTGIRAL